MWRLVVALVVMVALNSSVSTASVVIIHLRNGQLLEGNFVRATDKQVQIEIASQVITLSVDEVAAVLFDKTFTNSRREASGGTSVPDASRAVHSLQSVVETGTTLEDYRRRVTDAKIVVDQMLLATAASENPAASQALVDALGYHLAALSAWSLKINLGAAEEFIGLALNPYCQKCEALTHFVDQTVKPKKGIRDPTEVGIAISISGVQPLWECAGATLSTADSLLAR